MNQILAQNSDVPLGGFDNPGTGYQIIGVGNNPASAITVFERFISNVLALITILAGLSFLLFFIFGTIQWITAAGDEGKVADARKQMTHAGTGLVVTLVAYAIMTVISQVLGINFLDINDAISRIAPV